MSSARFGNLSCIGGLPSSSMSGNVLECPPMSRGLSKFRPGTKTSAGTERHLRSVQVRGIYAACAGTRVKQVNMSV